MNSIKICLVSDTIYDLNGVSRFIQDFAKEALVQEKHFYIIGSTSKTCEEEILNIYNFKPLFKIKMPFYNSLDLVFPNFFKIHRHIKAIKPDLLHISTPGFVGLCALISAKILKIKIAGIYHTDFSAYIYDNTKSKILKSISSFFLKLFYKRFNKIFSRTNEYKEYIKRIHHFQEKDLITLKPGINTKRFDDININSNYFQNKKFKLLYVGRVSVEKNIPFLLKLFKKLNNKDIELNLVGDIELKNFNLNEYENYNINFLGRKQGLELLNIYASSDVFIFPSTTDTLGQVVIEAMSSALVPIVTNKGGPKEFVNNEFGFVLDVEDKNAWLKTINNLSKDKDYLKKLQKKAKEKSNEFTISSSFEDFWNKNLEIINS